MSNIKLFQGGKVQLFDNEGNPLAGGKVYFYEPGTSTLKDTFNSSDLSVANANPVILDANGRATIYLSGNYKIQIDDASDVTLETQDNINPVSTTTAGNYNFVSNGSFEDNTLGDNKTPDGWTLTEESGSTVVLDATDQQHGDQSIKFTSAGNGGGNIISESFFEVNPNRDLDISYMLKSSVVDVRNVVEILWYDENQSSISSTTLLDDSTTNPTDWTKKEHAATPPSTARFAKIRMYGCHPSDVTTGSTWFDDLIVTISNSKETALPINFYKGGLVSINTTDSDHDIDIAACAFRNSDDDTNFKTTSTFTKQLDATFAKGTGNGGMASGASLPASGTVYIFAVQENSSGDEDFMADTDSAGANITANETDWTIVQPPQGFAYIASFITDGSNNLSERRFQLNADGYSQRIDLDAADNEFSNIPDWGNEVSVGFESASTNGSSQHAIELGISGGYVTSGYSSRGLSGGGVGVTSSAAVRLSNSTSAGDSLHGKIDFARGAENLWSWEGWTARDTAINAGHVTGTVDLGGVLTDLNITTLGGSNTYDNGFADITVRGF